ncbi:hypothetical protein ES332_A05G459500v1 [Gossypium tomentosum]|uniref:Choline monooxygenase, chloroplastic n=1 Tax=Gossypium tomentosum TaxID=34277 RepID=A0A5D2QT29_GOSTO|nr:hypothetical protein ES332_A05G459500v1 [Gossypium tomentosum]
MHSNGSETRQSETELRGRNIHNLVSHRVETEMTLLLKPITRLSLFQTHFQIINNNNPRARARAISVSCSWSHEAHKIVREFDPKIPIEKAITPPSSWYTDPSFYAFELDRVFYRGWQAVGYTEQIQEPRDFFSGRLGNVEFVVCRDDNGKIAAFHNVCRHHASLLVSGSGKTSCFTCPYHGWTYGLNGELRKATRISGIDDFSINDFGLVPIKVATWGPFVLLNMDNEILQKDNIDTDNVASEWLGSSSELFSLNGVDTTLTYVCRREYFIECNWKVFCDNYLDGGYHVPFAHKGLASGLSLDSYTTSIFEKVSIQSAEGGSKQKEDDRLGSKAFYAFIYPNFMINRYGPWMDTNLAIPLGPRKCLVVFDYFLEASFKDDKAFIERSLADSEKVQMEDIRLCEGVQKGIESPAYSTGRYAPNVEKAMHHFHCLLYDNLIN